MDEFGSRIRQSCDPTVAMVSFFFIPTQLAFSLVWPLKDLSYAGIYTATIIREYLIASLQPSCLHFSKMHLIFKCNFSINFMSYVHDPHNALSVYIRLLTIFSNFPFPSVIAFE